MHLYTCSFSSFVPCHDDRNLPYNVHNRADVYKDTSWGTEQTSCRDIYDPNTHTTTEVHRDYVRRLDLSNNLLQQIPEGIFDNLEISSLILRDNQISEIHPESVSNLNGLHYLDISGNNWECMPRICELRKWSANGQLIGGENAYYINKPISTENLGKANEWGGGVNCYRMNPTYNLPGKKINTRSRSSVVG